MKKIGIFGGTFDPVHFGHIHLALSLYEAHSLDQVLLIPSKLNPLKKEHPVSDEHRIEMLKLAFEKLSSFQVSYREIKGKSPSYTVQTLRDLYQELPGCQLYLMLGDDLVDHFMKWKEPEEIIRLATPLIGSRTSHLPKELPAFPKEVQEAFKKGWTKIPIREISATDVRKRLKDHLFSEHLLPGKVLDYIRQNHLYSY